MVRRQRKKRRRKRKMERRKRRKEEVKGKKKKKNEKRRRKRKIERRMREVERTSIKYCLSDARSPPPNNPFQHRLSGCHTPSEAPFTDQQHRRWRKAFS